MNYFPTIQQTRGACDAIHDSPMESVANVLAFAQVSMQCSCCLGTRTQFGFGGCTATCVNSLSRVYSAMLTFLAVGQLGVHQFKALRPQYL